MIRHFLSLLTVVTVMGCSYTTSQLTIPDSRPSIAIRNAPVDAILSVDGRSFGTIAQSFHDDQVVRLEPGTHLVVVSNAGQTLLSEKIFLGDGELRTLIVMGGHP